MNELLVRNSFRLEKKLGSCRCLKSAQFRNYLSITLGNNASESAH